MVDNPTGKMLRQAARTLLQSRAIYNDNVLAVSVAQRFLTPPSQFGKDDRASGLGTSFTALFAGAAACVAAGTSFAAADSSQQSKPTLQRPLILYQYDVCPWCNKVKAVLDYHKVPYRVVEVHPLTKKQLAFSDYKKVPVLVTQNGEQINDSSEIIKHVLALSKDANTAPPRRWFGKAKAQEHDAEVEGRWVAWADSTLVQVVTTNIYSSFEQAFQTMQYVNRSDAFGTFDRALAYICGGLVMYYVGVFKLPKKYGLEGVDLRQRLYDTVNEFADAVGNKPFMGGQHPDMSDLAVFGIIRAVQNTDAFYDMLDHSRIKPWWFRMVETVGESSRVEEFDK